MSHVLGRNLSYLDLTFQGHTQIIATAVLHGPGGVTLVDPGPSSCLPALRAQLAAKGIAPDDLRTLLLTHIHLDHAGATGTLVREVPHLQVFVHERGAPHLADPARLLDSARRLYGERMDELWGEFLAVPAANLRSLAGGERLTIGDRQLEVAHTPGHASHHVSYYDPASGIAFVGDAGGIRIGSGIYVMPPTPPPDIDLDAWRRSVARIEAWRPATLFTTHFGPHADPAPHLQVLLDHLDEMSRLVRRTLSMDVADDDRVAHFSAELSRHLRRSLSEVEAARYERAAPPWQCWQGLARYWRKRAA